MTTRPLWSMWWSGLFALVAIVHLIRGLGNIPITVGTAAIPIWVSWVVFPMAGLISGRLMRLALKRKPHRPFPPPPAAPGGLHPKSMQQEEPQPAGQKTSSVHAGAPLWGDDWPDSE